jgi:hypothetical protein
MRFSLIDFTSLHEQAQEYMQENDYHYQPDYVLNGIAFNANTNQYEILRYF